MHQTPAVSRPIWMRARPGGSGAPRRSPVAGGDCGQRGLVRDPHPRGSRSGLRAGWFGRWTDGVTALRGDCVAFAGTSCRPGGASSPPTASTPAGPATATGAAHCWPRCR